jgi:hypothetical protein
MTRPTTSSSGASRYEHAGRALDNHMDNCPMCQSGHGCPDGDDTAEEEFRAYRDWAREDPPGARAARIRPS